MKSTIKKIFGYSAMMVGSAFVAGLTTYTLMQKNGAKETIVTVQQEGGYAMPTALFDNKPAQPIDLTDAAESSLHAVVHIKSTQLGKTQTVTQMPDIFDFFFGFPQGGGMPQQRERVGSGSGVIIREDGYIVTNNHVISDDSYGDATKVQVTFSNETTVDATIKGTDSDADLAVLVVNKADIPEETKKGDQRTVSWMYRQ